MMSRSWWRFAINQKGTVLPQTGAGEGATRMKMTAFHVLFENGQGLEHAQSAVSR